MYQMNYPLKHCRIGFWKDTMAQVEDMAGMAVVATQDVFDLSLDHIDGSQADGRV